MRGSHEGRSCLCTEVKGKFLKLLHDARAKCLTTSNAEKESEVLKEKQNRILY